MRRKGPRGDAEARRGGGDGAAKLRNGEKGGGAGAWRWGVAWTAAAAAWGALFLGRGDPHFFWDPWGWGAALKAVALAVLAAAAFWGTAAAGCRGEKWMAWALAAAFLWVQFVWAKGAWLALKKVPWGFDHPSFMFRVWEFGKVFPGALGGYLPQWNGGVEHFVGVTSGAHAFGLLLWPFLQIWEPHVFYGAALAAWFIVAAPWLSVFSLRGAGAGWCAALCAGMAAAGASHEFFLWMWHFGTAGAMTSAVATVPAAALAWRVASGRGGWGSAVLLGVAAWMVCLWTPGAFVLAGLGAGWLLDWREWTRGKWAKLAVAAGVCAALWSPWLWTTLFPCHNVVEYVNTDLARPSWGTMAWNGAVSLWRRLPAANPVLLALGLGGLAAGAPRGMKRLLWPVVLVLAALAGWSRELKPLSQMDRMFIPLAMVLALPAAAVLDGVFGKAFGRDGDARKGGFPGWGRAAACLALGAVAAGLALEARTVRTHYRNERTAKLRTYRDGHIDAWVKWLAENVPEDARVAFAGRAVHAYGGGNTAYLPVLAGREMMGDDYYGFPRGTVEYNYPPRAYREGGEDGWRAFGAAYGVTHWVAVNPGDVKRLSLMEGLLEEAARFHLFGSYDITVFAVKGARGGRFLEGSGRVEAEPNRLRVKVDGGGRAVVRYNWRKGLFCKTPGAAIGPFEVDENLRFVAVEPGTNEWVEIGYKPHWSGIEPNFDGRFHH